VRKIIGLVKGKTGAVNVNQKGDLIGNRNKHRLRDKYRNINKILATPN
jgi:hypothetical protein